MGVSNFPSIRQYKIKESLGRGQYGDVYKVLNTNDKKIYCMKTILIQNENSIKIEKIKEEAEILKKLDNENIIKYYESFEEQDHFFIVMEYCETDLKKFIEYYKSEKNFMSESLILDFVLDICSGLKEIHSHQIIHRDLKPENLFVNNQLNIKIGDFGISKQLKSPIDYTESKGIGTLSYMAPEMIREHKYNHKVDIWALGCIVYELCTLNTYFKGISTLSEMINGIKSKGNINLKLYDIKVQNLIDNLLEKNDKYRPNIDEICDYCKALKRRNSRRQFENMLDCYYAMYNADNKDKNEFTSINRVLEDAENIILEDEDIKEDINTLKIKDDDTQDEKRETTGLLKNNPRN